MKHSEPIKSGPFFDVYNDRVEIFWTNVARFIIKEGGEMTTIADENANPQQVEIFKKGSPYTTSLYMKGHLVLHGSCLEINGKVCGFLGFSGAGKSTTAMALMKAGHKLISDDYLAFADINKSTQLLKGLPQVRLWEDAADYFDVEKNGQRIHENHNKHVYQADASEDVFELDQLFILTDNEEIEIEELKGFDALQNLMAQLKAIFFIHGKKEQENFLQLGTLLSKIKIAKLKRPRKHDQLGAVIEAVENYLAS